MVVGKEDGKKGFGRTAANWVRGKRERERENEQVNYERNLKPTVIFYTRGYKSILHV